MDIALEIGTWSAARRAIVRGDGTEIPLTPNEARLLEFLAANPDKILGVRELLTHVWGWSAKAESRTAYATIHRLRQKIEVDPLKPRHVVASHASGYRFCPLASATPVRVDGERVWGREAEIRWLDDRLGAGARRVLVLGAGGIGKTLLLRAVFARAVDAVWVSAIEADDAPSLLAAVHAALALMVTPGDPAEQVGRALVARGDPVLCIDNLEQVSDDARRMLDGWLETAPGARVVATSRVRLRCREEEVLDLGPLAAPPEGVALSEAERWPGLAMFLERVRRVRPNLKPEGLQAAAEIVRRVDGVPVCLELAAARARHLSLAVIADHLATRAPALLADPDPERGRHQAIRDVVEWSWALLDPTERAGGTQLAVFRGPFTLEAAAAVVDGDGAWVGDLLGALVDHSLLRLGDEPDARYRWLESVRAVVEGRLAADDPCRARHLRWMAAFGTEAACLQRMRVAGAADRRECRAAIPDLSAASRFAVTGGDPEDGVRVARALAQLVRSGLAVPGFVGALAALRSRPDLSPSGALELAAWEGEARLLAGAPVEGVALIERALGSSDGADATSRYRASRVLWTALRSSGQDHTQRLDALVDVLAPPAGPLFEADARVQRGTALAEGGRSSAAEVDLLVALRTSRALGCDLWTSAALGTLAYVYQQRGDLAGARALAQEAAALAEGCDDAHRTQMERTRLSTMDFMEGHFRAALGRLEVSRDILVRGGLAGRTVHITVNMAMCHWMLDDHETGLALFRAAEAAPTANTVNRVSAAMTSGALLGEAGREAESQLQLDAAWRGAHEHKLERVTAEMHRVLALGHLRRGDAAAALAAATEGVALLGPVAEPPRLALMRSARAEALARLGQAADAARERDLACDLAAGIAWAEMSAAVRIAEAKVSALIGEHERASRACAAAAAVLAGMEIGPGCYLHRWLREAEALTGAPPTYSASQSNDA